MTSHRLLSVLLVAPVAVAATACVGDDGRPFSVQVAFMESPAGSGSGEPFLETYAQEAYLTWLEASEPSGHDLRLARLEGDGWSEPTTIAHSELFFVNWADFPSVTRDREGTLWAHWLERGGKGTYDYGIRVVRSDDGGRSWSEPYTLHDDASPTEHGFVSTVTWNGGIGFAWLDGRRYAPGEDGTPAANEMTLRYRAFEDDGDPGPELLVDGRVCDCCQTASALTEAGPVLVYRNRTEDEIRDIYVARQEGGVWKEGVPVHDDGWGIAGCPVNGPAVDARAMEVVVAWFTAPEDVARVKVAFSSDGGATFDEPVVVDDGNPGGRVDVVLTERGDALVTWLERTGGEMAEVRIRRVERDGARSASASITGSSSARASGFPRMRDLGEGEVLMAWTDVEGAEPQVRVARVEVR